ncbi:hypothetical protein EJB05_24422, partial [Eragrostis curvula]
MHAAREDRRLEWSDAHQEQATWPSAESYPKGQEQPRASALAVKVALSRNGTGSDGDEDMALVFGLRNYGEQTAARVFALGSFLLATDINYYWSIIKMEGLIPQPCDQLLGSTIVCVADQFCNVLFLKDFCKWPWGCLCQLPVSDYFLSATNVLRIRRLYFPKKKRQKIVQTINC